MIRIMAIDLTGARSKIERAKKHIRDFDAERIAFLGSNPYVVIAKFHAERNVTESTIGTIPKLPDNLALIAGDAAHSLRAALDYLACELVRSAGETPKNVYFPICESSEKYIAQSPGKTKGMPISAKQIIDQIEPYKSGQGEPLWFLHTIDIADKHVVLVSVCANVAKTVQLQLTPELTEFSVIFSAPGLKEGDVLGEVSGNSEANQRINFSFDIAFGQPGRF
jgi:hypothetical protein